VHQARWQVAQRPVQPDDDLAGAVALGGPVDQPADAAVERLG